MNQKDKELSFIDISGRLHYGVIVNYKENEYDHREWKITNLHTLSYSKSGTLIDTDYDGWISYEEYKGCGMSSGSRPFRFGEVIPYLRPLSSMTKKETKELFKEIGFKFTCNICGIPTYYIYEFAKQIKGIPTITNVEFIKVIDWLNAHHFDYRGLIEKGLAIAVTKENNPYEN